MPFEQPKIEEEWEAMERKTELFGNLREWSEKMTTKLQERAKNFNMPEEKIKEIESEIFASIVDFRTQIEEEEKREALKKNSAEVISKLSNKEEKKRLQNLLDQFSEKYLVDLFYRRLTGNVSEDEETLLKTFSAVKEGKVASYNPVTESTEINFLNTESQEENTEALMHEFTHKALWESIAQKRKLNLLWTQVRGIELRKLPLEKQEKLSKAQKGELFYSIFWDALDESLAHRASHYFVKKKKEPSFKGYKKKMGINPKLFKDIYNSFDKFARNHSLEEFDKFASHIFAFAAGKWEKDLSPEEVEKIIKSTALETIKYREK